VFIFYPDEKTELHADSNTISTFPPSHPNRTNSTQVITYRSEGYDGRKIAKNNEKFSLGSLKGSSLEQGIPTVACHSKI